MSNKQDINFLSWALAIYSVAVVVLILDLFYWRPF